MPGEQPNKLKLPKWVKVSKKRFDVIKSKVQTAKKDKLMVRPNRNRLITSNESSKLLQDIEHGKITYEEALKKMTNIRGDIYMLVKLKSFTQNQNKMLNILFMVDKIFTGKLKTLQENNEGYLDIFK